METPSCANMVGVTGEGNSKGLSPHRASVQPEPSDAETWKVSSRNPWNRTRDKWVARDSPSVLSHRRVWLSPFLSPRCPSWDHKLHAYPRILLQLHTLWVGVLTPQWGWMLRWIKEHSDCSAPAQGGGFVSAPCGSSEQADGLKEGFGEERELQQF